MNFIFQYILTIAPDLQKLLEETEKILKSRVKYLETQYQKRCTSQCLPSYLSCTDNFPPQTCSLLYNRTECECSETKDSKISLEEGVVAIPDYSNRNDPYITEMACLLSGMDRLFKDSFGFSNGTRWQYVATYNKVYRKYPASPICNFDPTKRPWFQAAATGAKNVLILMDNSGSMMNSSLSFAKKAAKDIVETLTINDWVGLITFNNKATAHTPNLIRASIKNKEFLNMTIDKLDTSPGTNYHEAFTTVYQLINSTRKDEKGPISCQTIILFLTDDLQSEDNDVNDLVNLLESLEKEYQVNATLISYSFGTRSNPYSLLPLTCLRNGFVEAVANQEQLSDKMTNYFNFLTYGITRRDVVWTEPYMDNSGLGLMITAALPFYDVKIYPPKFIGVTAIDIMFNEFSKYDTDNLLDILVERSSICTKFSLSPCQLQELRGDLSCPIESICSSIGMNKFLTCPILFQNVYRTYTDEYKSINKFGICCSNKNICFPLWHILGPIIAVVAIIIILLIILFRKRLCSKNQPIFKPDPIVIIPRQDE